VAVALAITLAMGLVAGCSGDDDSDDASAGGGDGGDEKVTISVSNLPPETEEATRDAFLARVQEFEDANPNITIEPNEWEWDAATFTTQLAGGTLPTTFEFPFTDGQALIARGQLADVTAEVEDLPYAADFNPSVLQVVQSDDKIYGVPSTAYGMGLHYNRAMFEEAGLDPDEPPTSWDEVREDAKAIADATGQAGYAEMTQDNTGGWILTTLTYSLGGRIQEGTGDDVSATVDNDATKEALQLLHDMRWEDDSMGDNFLFDWGSINQAFAAGQVGMYVTGSDVYNSLVTENDVKADEYGLTVLPLTDGDDAGVLGGGTIVGVKPDASDAERAAAVKWIDFFYMSKLTDEDAAVADAEALTASDGPLGTPTLPIFDEEHLAESDGWIADYVNVPLEQMLPFKDNILGQDLVPEPPVDAQATYAELDTVVQAVLTDENADIDALLERANDNVESLIAAAA
jgi:ABC-type glycerol-3-phosphate transport system substrate-binding protein